MSRSLVQLCAHLFVLAICLSSEVWAQDKPLALTAAQLTELKAADDARIAAMREPMKSKLDSILSADLHYAHSNGLVDTKNSLVETLTSGKTKYLEMNYEKRDFSSPAPGIALMTGRIHVKVASGESKMESSLSYLAVWRLESGTWRFLAWQSCKVP